MHTYDLCDPLSHELNGYTHSSPDPNATFDVLLSVHDVHESKGCPVCHSVFQSVLLNSLRFIMSPLKDRKQKLRVAFLTGPASSGPK